MSELPTKNRNDDINSKIADFMADIDEIVCGKKTDAQQPQQEEEEESEWKQCFDETSQTAYYWNTKTNECSWDPPPVESSTSTSIDEETKKRDREFAADTKLPKKLKKPKLIAEYTSSESESDEDDIDELLEEVLDQNDKMQKNKIPPVDPYPLFEADCRAAIARLVDLGDRSAEISILRVQLETRLEDTLAGHLTKSYAVSKLDEALVQIEELEKLYVTTNPLPMTTEPAKPSLTTSEMALLLSLPPPPPPPSPPPPPICPQLSSNENEKALQMFYAQLQSEQTELPQSLFTSDKEKPSIGTKPDHHHHHHHKDKKSKPAKTLPTDLIQKWTHARNELCGIPDIDDS
ncbi:unnamed protein product [Adineta ricciae]|uniref:WW domain-containing protein n=1 Tax=Adineta ricciae TaxID=249248 RepID=A0A814LUS9_ADIRI|nr:unnamed protein product [Adineta ricciae]CAF1552112.1 unnamed protein product [Adineta ricciae]